MADNDVETPTARERAKTERQDALVRAASALFARKGFGAVSIEELGAAVGVSGPALYRHFAGKQALLGEILVGASERLLEGGRTVIAAHDDPGDQLDALVRFHVAFALADADVIRVQDRDLENLHDPDRHRVRRLQREYVELWTRVLQHRHPDVPATHLRVRAHAVFGLINSTPHSVRGLRGAPGDQTVGAILHDLALRALDA